MTYSFTKAMAPRVHQICIFSVVALGGEGVLNSIARKVCFISFQICQEISDSSSTLSANGTRTPPPPPLSTIASDGTVHTIYILK